MSHMSELDAQREQVARYKFPACVVADYLARTIRTEGVTQEYVLASDFDALEAREAWLQARVQELEAKYEEQP